MKALKQTLYSITLFLATFCQGCGLLNTASKPAVEKLPAAYDYAPPESGFTKSKDVSFLLMKPAFVKSFDYIDYAPFQNFAKAMAADYEEMLTKRGYPFIGPINSFDEIVYADKKNSDLTLESELDFNINGNPFRHTNSTTFIGNQPVTRYYANGETTISGKINFFVSEPFTHTKIWVKSIPIEPQTLYIKSSRNNFNTLDEVTNDAQVWNTYVTALQKIYIKSLQTAWKYLEPEELIVKKKEAIEIRKNSSFQKN